MFLDGKLVAAADFDRAFDADMSKYVYRIESGSNPVNGLGELVVFQRDIGLGEIDYLWSNSFGTTPVDTNGLSGYYRFAGDLSCDSLANVDYTINEAAVIRGTDPPPYLTDGGAPMALAPERDSIIQLGADVLPSRLKTLTVGFWFQEEMDNDSPVNLMNIVNPGSRSAPPLDLTIEPGGRLVLTVGTNWNKIWYRPGNDFDDGEGHMITLRFRNW